MSQRRHEPYEELISASLAGDLTREERALLDGHLRACAGCRATMTAFREQRRMVSGLRHLPPPRNLRARVHFGIERGAFAPVPWWRRPAAALVGIAGAGAVAAGALLAVVLLNAQQPDRVASTASAEPTPTVAVTPTVEPTSTPEVAATLQPTAAPTQTPEPSPPHAIGFGAVNYVALDGDSQAAKTVTLEGMDPVTGEETSDEPGEPSLLTLNESEGDSVVGPPVAVSLEAETGRWLAYQTLGDGKGVNQIWAVEMNDVEYRLGETPDDSAFSRRMVWSPDGRYLAYTAASVDEERGPDVWILDTRAPEQPVQLTDTQASYVASFEANGDGVARLWVSTAGEPPMSYLVELPLDGDLPERLDGDALAEASVAEPQALFQPILSPNRDYALFWRGAMERPEGEVFWQISTGGMLYLTGEPDGQINWESEQVFPELSAGRDALRSAHLAWSFDNDRFAVWDVAWTGTPLGDPESPFPDQKEVYIGSAEDRQLIRASDDEGHLRLFDPEGHEYAVNVAFVGPTKSRIAVTIFEEAGGSSGESPVARSRLEVFSISGADGAERRIGAAKKWAGPAFYVRQGGEQP
jgi:hypothetical protein